MAAMLAVHNTSPNPDISGHNAMIQRYQSPVAIGAPTRMISPQPALSSCARSVAAPRAPPRAART